MADNIVRIDGWPVAVGTAAAFGRLKAAFDAEFDVTLHVYSGYRSAEEQAKIFLDRYVPRATGTGPYGDVRWWNGVRYVRFSGEGTVAVPGTSNHGNGRALDIRDSGQDAGVTRAGNARANWIRSNASRYGFDPAGYGFSEPWHIELSTSIDQWSTQTATPADTDSTPITTDQGVADADYERELEMSAAEDVQWIKNRIGGSLSRPKNITQEIDELKEQVARLVTVVGGSIDPAKNEVKGGTLSQRLADLQSR